MSTTTRILLACIVVPLCACQWGTMPDEEFDRKYGDRLKGPGGTSMFYGTEASTFAQSVAKELGTDGLVSDLSLSFKSAYFEGQVPGDTTRKQGYRYEDGSFDLDEASDPITNSEAGEFFRIGDVPLDNLPELVRIAHQALGEKDRFVRMVTVSVDRYYIEYLTAKSTPGAVDDVRLRRLYLGPEASPSDKGIRLRFHFGESGASSSVELDANGRVVSVSKADVVTSGGAAPAPKPSMLDAVSVLAASRRLEAAFGVSPLSFREILVYPDYIYFTVVDPKDTGRTERYDFRDGQFGRASITTDTKGQAERSFTLQEANLALMDLWLEKALKAAGPIALVKYLDVEPRYRQDSLSVVVHMESGGRSIWAQLAPDGTLVELHD